jgi:hypothetical protein
MEREFDHLADVLMLRLAFLRGLPGGFAAALFASAGVTPVSRSPSSSASCSATIAASRSDRLPKHHVLERLHHNAQLVVLSIEGEHHLGQSRCVD